MRERAIKPEYDGMVDPRETAEYRNGRGDFVSGVANENCPHKIGDCRRTYWYTGWYDAYMNSRLGAIFVRHGLTYP